MLTTQQLPRPSKDSIPSSIFSSEGRRTPSLSGEYRAVAEGHLVKGERPVVFVSWTPSSSSTTSMSQEPPAPVTEEYIWDNERSIESIVQELVGSLFGLNDTRPEHYVLWKHSDLGESILIYPESKEQRTFIGPGANLSLSLSPRYVVESSIQSLSDALSEREKLEKQLFLLHQELRISENAVEFYKQGGLAILTKLVSMTGENTLAYALHSLFPVLQVQLSETDKDSESIRKTLLKDILVILNDQTFLDILSPATQITLTLLGHKSVAEREATAVNIRAQFPELLNKLVGRIKQSDLQLQVSSLKLINLILECTPSEEKRSEIFYDLDDVNLRSILSDILASQPSTELTQEIDSFTKKVRQELRKRLQIPVDPLNEAHKNAMEYFIRALRMLSQDDALTWMDLGCSKEPHLALKPFGILGLETLLTTVQQRNKELRILLDKQYLHPLKSQCPLIPAILEVCRMLVDYWRLSDASRDSDCTFLLRFEFVFGLVIESFAHLWISMDASQDNHEDLKSVSKLFAMHFANAMKSAKEKSRIEDLKKLLLNMPYEKIPSLSFSRPKPTDEQRNKAEDVIRIQRLKCLKEGAWFALSKDRKSMGFRFYKLSEDGDRLYWADFTNKSEKAPSMETLNEYVDRAYWTCLTAEPSNPVIFYLHYKSPELEEESNLVFHCLSSMENAEWLDGLRILLNESGCSLSREAQMFSAKLASVECRIQKIKGEFVTEEGSKTRIPPLPLNYDFFYRV